MADLENTASEERATASAEVSPESPATITLNFNKGKKPATYTLGQEITLNLGLAYEREAAEAILDHISSMADDEAHGGYEFFYPGELDVTDLPTIGRLTFAGKSEGKGADKEVKAIILAYVPPIEEFLRACAVPAKEFFETEIAKLLAGISRRLIDISPDAVRLTGEIPSDAFAILAPKARGVGTDRFMPIAVAFTSYLITQGTGGKLKIPAGDVRRAIASAHFVQTSAYKDLEKVDSTNPKGLFGTALAKLEKLLTSAVNDPAKMQAIVDTLRTLVRNKTAAESINAAFLTDMQRSAWCERMAHERLTAVLKASKIRKSETEAAGDALLAMLA